MNKIFVSRRQLKRELKVRDKFIDKITSVLIKAQTERDVALINEKYLRKCYEKDFGNLLHLKTLQLRVEEQQQQIQQLADVKDKANKYAKYIGFLRGLFWHIIDVTKPSNMSSEEYDKLVAQKLKEVCDDRLGPSGKEY